MSKPTGTVPIRVLIAVQGLAVGAILALLVLGLFVLKGVSHRTAESAALTDVHRESGVIGDRLQQWLAEEGAFLFEPPDFADPVSRIQLATEVLRGFGPGDAAKADEIDRQLGALLDAVERMVAADDPLEAYLVEVAALERSFKSFALDLELDEITELEESLGLVATTEMLLIVLGPLLLAITLLVVRTISRLRIRSDRAEAAEELVRSKDDFLARVTHELRTPLTGVVGLAAVLRDEKLEPEEKSELIATVASESSELAGLVEDLLVASIADLGELRVARTEVDVGESVDSSVASFDQVIPVVVEPGGVRAIADPVRVRQVLRNLLSNAFKHGGGSVSIDVSKRDGLAEVVVGDGGPAISADVATSIFEPYQTRVGRIESPGSVGVGLSISRDLARRMGGELKYRHTGSRSEFVLSLVAADSVTPASGKDAKPAAGLEAA